MDGAARPIDHVVDKVERAVPRELLLVAERDFDLVGERTSLRQPAPRELQVVGFAHVEVEIDRVKRNDRTQQRRRTGCGAAAGDEVANRDQVRANAPSEGGHDAAVLKIELGVADLCLGVVHGGLCGLPVGGALVDGLFRTERFSRQLLSAMEFAIGERKPCTCCLQLCIGLRQLDFVGPCVDREEQVALMDDVPILEVYTGERAADLGSLLYLFDRRELAKEAETRIELANERLA